MDIHALNDDNVTFINFIINNKIVVKKPKKIEKKTQNLKGTVVYNNDECRVLEYRSDYLKVYNLNKNKIENILRCEIKN